MPIYLPLNQVEHQKVNQTAALVFSAQLCHRWMEVTNFYLSHHHHHYIWDADLEEIFI